LASLTSSAVVAGTWLPRTEADRDAVLRQLDRILNSSVFRNSKRYPALLKFIVEQTLDGRADEIKERILGIEVFGRAPDYDTNTDHVVRTAAGEVRKRLAQYYVEAGRGDELRIDVPPGAYIAQFRVASEPAAALPILALTGATPETRQGFFRRGTPAVRFGIAISVFANLVLAAVLLVRVNPGSGGASTLEKFWDPVFATGPVLICVGLHDGPSANDEGDTLPLDPLMHRVSMADLLALARVASYAGERHVPYRVLDPIATRLSDLRNDPTILIGVGNNNWTTRMTDQLRFNFAFNGTANPVAIIDKRDPARKDWLRSNDPATDSSKDYAVVSRMIDPTIEQMVVIVGGLGPHATEVAGEFITDPDQIRKLEAYAPAGWKNKNLQVVLSTRVVKGSSGPPKIEAVYFW
jgi:hypothetical protein